MKSESARDNGCLLRHRHELYGYRSNCQQQSSYAREIVHRPIAMNPTPAIQDKTLRSISHLSFGSDLSTFYHRA